MKFANIIYNKRNRYMNLGDDMQLLAIENLYDYMNIDYRDVVRIEFSNLHTWDGEDLIVPISFPLFTFNQEMHVTCFSEKIHPVFLAVSILTDTLDDSDVEYLNRYAPIGCRDNHTFHTMKKYNIDAYLFGCTTLTFPRKRQADLEKSKIFCVDSSENVLAKMPPEMKKECIFMSNMCYVEELDKKSEEKEREIYNMLINEAKLVITTRMHVALPCIAAGIPVVFARDMFSFRFSGIDRIARIYTEEQYDSIDWNPKPIEYETIKEKMLNLAVSRIYNRVEEYRSLISDLNECLADRKVREGKVESVYYTEKYLESRFSPDENFDYIIWAVTQTAEMIYQLLKRKWKNARLAAVVDRGKQINFHGRQSELKEAILNNRNATVLVCTVSAIGEAREYFAENGIDNYFYCFKDDEPLK